MSLTDQDPFGIHALRNAVKEADADKERGRACTGPGSRANVFDEPKFRLRYAALIIAGLTVAGWLGLYLIIRGLV